jgi:hypothetical protein
MCHCVGLWNKHNAQGADVVLHCSTRMGLLQAFINIPSHQHTLTSTYSHINVPLHQCTLTSTYPLINIPSHQCTLTSTYPHINVPSHQMHIWSQSQWQHRNHNTNFTMQHPSKKLIHSQLVYLAHLHLGLQCSHFHSGFPATTLTTFLSCIMHATCLTHLILLNFIILLSLVCDHSVKHILYRCLKTEDSRFVTYLHNMIYIYTYTHTL